MKYLLIKNDNDEYNYYAFKNANPKVGNFIMLKNDFLKYGLKILHYEKSHLNLKHNKLYFIEKIYNVNSVYVRDDAGESVIVKKSLYDLYEKITVEEYQKYKEIELQTCNIQNKITKLKGGNNQ